MTILSYAKQTPELGVGYVYKWTNLVNGMMYIGSHQGTNPRYIGSGKRFRRAVKKYGIENFHRIILYTGPYFTQVEEEILVAIDAECKDNIFYNFTNQASIGYRGKTSSEETRRKQSQAHVGILHTEETKIKISVSTKGLRRSEETCIRISLSKVGENHPMFGKSQSEETRKKRSQTMIGVKHSEERRLANSKAQTGKVRSERSKLNQSYTSHLKHYSKGMFVQRCRWCQGDDFDFELSKIQDIG